VHGFILACMVVAATVSCGCSGSGGHSHDRRPTISGGVRRHATIGSPEWFARIQASPDKRRFGRELAAHFAILRRRPEHVPAAVSGIVESTGFSPRGLKEAHYAYTRAGGIWVFEEGGVTLCMIEARSGASACNAWRSALAEGIALGTSVSGAHGGRLYTVVGVAPDWARAARLSIGGSHRRTAIRDDAYSAMATRRIIVTSLER
jgi:hypothetical protein